MNDVVSSGISEVSRPRRWLVGTLAIGLIVGHASDVIARGEHWPFSGYPMYADMITTPTFRLVRLFAVTGEAPLREVAIEQGWMRNNLNRILRRADAMVLTMLELSFPLALVSRVLRIPIVTATFLMQVGIGLTLGIWFLPFIMLYAFWVP